MSMYKRKDKSKKLSPMLRRTKNICVLTEREASSPPPTTLYIAYGCMHGDYGWLGALSIRRSFDKPRQMSTDRRLLSR